MIEWLRKRLGQVPTEEVTKKEPLKKGGLFSTHRFDSMTHGKAGEMTANLLQTWNRYLKANAPRVTLPDGTMDSSDGFDNIKMAFNLGQPNVSEAIFQWYGTQSFVGHQMCAIIAQHWMVEKICITPARDAIRQGFELINAPGEDELENDVIAAYAQYDERFKLDKQLLEFVYFGRVFGIRVAVPIIESGDPDFYEKQFNADGITPGSFKGWMQIDPYWMSPILDADAAGRPDTPNFYEPTWWLINGKRYHRTHLCIFRTQQPADILKPSYLYSGVPVPQKIMERVYAAERTGNEAPLLVMTKRLYGLKLDNIDAAFADKENFDSGLRYQQEVQDNFGMRIMGKDDDLEQFDTALTDLWTTIEGEYALACAAGDAPVNKIMGTAAGGLSNEGAYDESNYHEALESIQTHDLTPFVMRHHLLVKKSYIEPKFGAVGAARTAISWLPLDSPTALEYAQINETNARADLNLVQTGAISDADVNVRLRNDKNSGYNTIRPILEGEREPSGAELDDELDTGTPGKVTVSETKGGDNGNSTS
jgi:uncharacterized protein